MSTRPIQPLTAPLDTVVRVPGSKSLTNRLLLLAALAEGVTTLENALFSDDSARLAESLQRLGFSVEQDQARSQIDIYGLGGMIPAPAADLYVGNAGTAARFLTALLTLGTGTYTLDGDARMRERPIGDLLTALHPLGAEITPLNTDRPAALICPPLGIVAQGLDGGHTQVAGEISSQYLSAMLMVSPYARQPVTITVTGGLNSKPYVDLTLSVMADFGVRVARQGYQHFEIEPGRYRTPGLYVVESDASAASYFWAAPAICGGQVTLANMRRSSSQGDIAFLDVLQEMGCTYQEVVEGAIRVDGPKAELRGVDVDLRDIPDTAQTLAAIAPFAVSATRIRGIASARHKETDRVAAVCMELARLGVGVEEHPDGMTIQPCRDFRPARIETYHDHRMAMAFALIGLRVPGVEIADPGCVSKTFPNYFEVLEQLRGRA